MTYEMPDGVRRLSSSTRKLPGVVAHEVDPGHVDAHPADGVEALDAPVVVRRAGDEPAGHDAVGEDLAGAVDVAEEPLEREHPLAHAGIDDRPLVGVDDAGHEVEREGPLLLARELERDALITERTVARRAAHLEVVARERAEHRVQCRVVRAGRVDVREHLVPVRAPAGNRQAGRPRGPFYAASVTGRFPAMVQPVFWLLARFLPGSGAANSRASLPSTA